VWGGPKGGFHNGKVVEPFIFIVKRKKKKEGLGGFLQIKNQGLGYALAKEKKKKTKKIPRGGGEKRGGWTN